MGDMTKFNSAIEYFYLFPKYLFSFIHVQNKIELKKLILEI